MKHYTHGTFNVTINTLYLEILNLSLFFLLTFVTTEYKQQQKLLQVKQYIDLEKKSRIICIRYNLASKTIVEYVGIYSFVECRNKDCKLHILFYIDAL